jgi:hypothetical protein
MMALPQWDSYTWGIGRQRAVELFEEEISRALLERQETIELPIFAAQVILSCAKNGQHRGHGRQRPPESENDRIAKRAIVLYARRRWAELGWKRGTKLQAAKDVLDEDRAGTKLGKRVNFSPEYLMQLMGPKPKA